MQYLSPIQFLLKFIAIIMLISGLSSCGGGQSASFTITPIADTTVAENTAFTGSPPAIIGTPVGAVTYTLGGADAASFTIDSASGVISMIARDFESPADTNADNAYEVTIIATDSDADIASEAQTVTVTDVVELGKLNDTGLILCGNYAYGGGSGEHNNNLDCTGTDPNGNPIPPGQDATSGRDANPAANADSDGHKGFSFSKLDASGVALTDQTSATFSCVKDNITQLTWQVKTTSGLHNAADRYNWYNTDTTTNGGNAGFANDNGNICHGYDVSDVTTYCNTEAYIARVNTVGHCGTTDWRLPTREELRSLASRDRFNPAIDTAYFPNTVANGSYWSSSPYAPSVSSAWFINFFLGSTGAPPKSNDELVRLVRSGQ